jgi:organic hydroperoxide reductase OsmC/OhrA
MSTHTATILWERAGAVFTDGHYARTHKASFDGGVNLAVTTALPLPSNTVPAADPEEMVVAATASCHMMFFLAFAKQAGFIVDTYHDAPSGTLGKDEAGVERFIEVVLNPKISWGGDNIPGTADLDLFHHKAHRACYIGNSLACPVRVAA